MTDREKAIVMAYTGICMLTEDKFQIFHKYVEDIMGRPVYTHELAYRDVQDEIKEKAKADFIALCAEQESCENMAGDRVTCKDCKHLCHIEDAPKVLVCGKHNCQQVSKNYYCADAESEEEYEKRKLFCNTWLDAQ